MGGGRGEKWSRGKGMRREVVAWEAVNADSLIARGCGRAGGIAQLVQLKAPREGVEVLPSLFYSPLNK